mgnify:CR=1 FL=1
MLGFYNWQSQHSLEGDLLVVTNTSTDVERTYPMGKDAQFEVKGELGTSIIEVHDGKARFVSSPCPDQLCIHVFGWISKENELSFCLPNQVLLEIREEKPAP